MRSLLPPVSFIVCLFLAASNLSAEPGEPIKIWPNGAPGDEALEIGEQNTEMRDGEIAITRNVKEPTLTIYPAPEDNNKGVTLLVCPGGGYNVLANSHEGTEICEWLNEHGVNAALLMYRVPRRPDREKHVAPLQDVQRAMTILRSKAVEWKMDADRIGILGFSAGGHLSSMALTSDGKRTYPADAVGDEPDVKLIPDFGILVYPAYLTDKDDPVALSPEVKVTESTPPTFLVVAHNDTKYVEGSARFYIQMLRNKRPCELHIYQRGGHGFGMKKSPHRVAKWPGVALGWMNANGYTK